VIPAASNPIDAPGTDEETWRTWIELEHLPAVDISAWRSAVVIAAHPDDEVLGAGGTMCLLAAAGARLRLVSVTDGEASHPGIAEPQVLAQRRLSETEAALRVLGAHAAEVVRLRLPDTGLAGREDEIAALLRNLTAGFDIVLAPWDQDVHADHEAAGHAARLASQRTLFYPVWMWHWAFPGDPRVPWDRAVRVPLTPWVAGLKRRAIGCFASQLEDRPAGAGPVLAPGTVAHFTRAQEVFLR
jgi:LmbE family N-acetylglucosaminyl deacetylase